MSAPTVLVVADEAHVQRAAVGGVQLCTQEYIALLEACGCRVDVHAVRAKPSFRYRASRRLGVDVYGRYDVGQILPGVVQQARASGASVIALNQVDLMRLAPGLRGELGGQVRLVVLSHGNESGDFLHEVVRRPGRTAIARARDAVRLGYCIREEARLFGTSVNLVLCLSDVEMHIDQWLGANDVVVVPRTFQPRPIEWTPVRGRVGFVGTLDHLPNAEGIRRVLDEVAARPGSELEVHVVGRPEREGRALAERYPFVRYLGGLDEHALEREAGTWSLFLNPVWWYARGASTKLAQGISWGLPVVTTTAGRRGYVWGRGDVLTADDPVGFVDLAERYATDQSCLAAAASQVRDVCRSGPTLADIAAQVAPRLIARPAVVDAGRPTAPGVP